MALTTTKPIVDPTAWYKRANTSSGATDIAATAYANAVSFFEKELSQDEHQRDWIRGYTSMYDVVEAIDQAKTLYDKKAEQNKKARKWVDNLARTITCYGGVLDTVVQCDPMHAALAWGALKFVFVGVLNHSQLVAELSKALTKIGEVLPRVQVDASLYDTPWMKEATSKLYAYILLFLQSAVKWYTMSSARRAVSSFFKPYSLVFGDVVEEISRCTATVEAIASTSGRAEVRGLTLSFEESDKKLQTMQLRLNDLQAASERTEAVVMRVLQVALNNHQLSHDIKIDTSDSRARICDLQFSRILQVLGPGRLPEDTLETCRSFTKRRPSWRQPGRDTTVLMQRISEWVFMSGSSLFVVQASPRAESRTKDLVVELTGLLKGTVSPVFWYLSEPSSDRAAVSPSIILKNLLFQALRYDPSIASRDVQLGNIRAFEAEHTLAEWIGLVAKVFSTFKECFVVVECDDSYLAPDRGGLEVCQVNGMLASLFNAVSNSTCIIKMLVVTYRRQSMLLTTAGNASRIWAKVDPPLPASRRATYQVPLQLRRSAPRRVM